MVDDGTNPISKLNYIADGTFAVFAECDCRDHTHGVVHVSQIKMDPKNCRRVCVSNQAGKVVHQDNCREEATDSDDTTAPQ